MGAILLILLSGLLVGVLAAPLSLEFDLARRETIRAHWRFAWLYGLVTASGPGRKPRRDQAAQPKRSPPAAPRRRRQPGASRSITVLRTRGLGGSVLRLVSDLLRLLRPDQFYLHTSFGFADPADTGVAYGVIAPVLVAATSRGFDVRCRPDFVREGLRGRCGGRLSARPATILWTGLRFLCRPPTLRALGTLWMTRSRRGRA